MNWAEKLEEERGETIERVELGPFTSAELRYFAPWTAYTPGDTESHFGGYAVVLLVGEIPVDVFTAMLKFGEDKSEHFRYARARSHVHLLSRDKQWPADVLGVVDRLARRANLLRAEKQFAEAQHRLELARADSRT